MLSKLKTTLKHTTIYSLGNIGSKLVGIVLLPIYTKYFTVSEYGVLGILEITIFILTQVLLLGLPVAFLRFYTSGEYSDKRASIFPTIFFLQFWVALLILVLGQFFVPRIALYFGDPSAFNIYLKLSVYIIVLRLINNLFLSVLRANEKSIYYAVGNLTKIIVVLFFNIYFIVFAKIGLKGILYSYIIGEILLLLIILPAVIPEMKFRFDRKILTASIVFGFPLIFASLADMLLNMGDRYILKLLANYKEVGLYDLGYRVAGIINVFLVQSFSLAFLPQAYKFFGEEGDKRYFSKMLTYFVLVLCWTGLGISFYGEEAIKILALNPDFWPAYKVIPIIVFAFIFSGAKTVTNIGLFLKNKTQYVALNTIIAALLNIGLNFALIPEYGMMGAAYATLISFFVLFLLSYYFSNRYYAIPYENWKVVKMITLALSLYLLSTLLAEFHIAIKIVLKTALLLIYPLILYFLKFYEEVEIEKIVQWSKRNILRKILPK